MAEISIEIGGRPFEVACQTEEIPYLKRAAALLDAEASTVTNQLGRMPAERMLLLAGLMLADKLAGKPNSAPAEPDSGDSARKEAKAEPVIAPPDPEVTMVLHELAGRSEAVAAALESWMERAQKELN